MIVDYSRLLNITLHDPTSSNDMGRKSSYHHPEYHPISSTTLLTYLSMYIYIYMCVCVLCICTCKHKCHLASECYRCYNILCLCDAQTLRRCASGCESSPLPLEAVVAVVPELLTRQGYHTCFTSCHRCKIWNLSIFYPNKCAMIYMFSVCVCLCVSACIRSECVHVYINTI